MKPSTLCTVAFLASAAILPLRAQLAVRALFHGGYLPVVHVGREYLTVLEDDRRQSTGSLSYFLQPGADFADGFVQIEHVHADLDPLHHQSPGTRADASSVRFRYDADVVAKEPISDCYLLLTFVSQGSVGTHLAWIGRLRAGEPAHVKVELPTAVDSVGTLHLFRDGREIRSNVHPSAYDAKAYLATLVRNVTGLPAADLLRVGRYYAHVLSDDGHYLATVRDVDGRQMLLAIDVGSMKLVCEARIADEDAYAANLTWVSDHEIAYVAADDVKNYPDRIGLHLLDTRTGRTRMIKPDIREIVEREAGHPDVLVVAARHNGDTYFKYDVHTGRVFDFEDPSSGTYWFDPQGIARVRQQSDGDGSTYAARSTPTSSWHNLDEIARTAGVHFAFDGAHLLDCKIKPICMDGNSDVLYVASRSASDTYAIAKLSLSRGVIERTVARLPTYDLDPSGYTTLLFGTTPTRHLIGLRFNAERPEVAWIDSRFAAAQREINAACPGHVNLPVTWAQDGSVVVFFSTSDRDPGSYDALRPGSHELIPLLTLGTRLAGKALATTTPIWFTARDGAKIPAYVTHPTLPGKGPVPLVVRIHDGPFARAVWGYDPLNQFLASRGFEVLQVNYRGSSGYGAAFQKAGLEAQLDTVIIDDVADGVRHLVQTGEVDPRRIVAYGQGMFGGWAALISLARYPKLYAAGIEIRGITDWRRHLGSPDWTQSSYWRALLDRPDNASHDDAIEPCLRAAEIKQPVFMIDRQDSADAEKMLKALKKTGGNVQAWSYRQSSFSVNVEIMNQVAGFLARCCGTARQSSTPTPAN